MYLMSVMSQCYSIIIHRGISALGNGKEVAYGLNSVYKRYIYQWMSTVQIPGSNRFYSQIQMHTGNQNYDVSLAKEFQQHLTKEHCKNGVFDKGGNNKRFMEIKWTYRQYHVQDNSYVAHKYVKIYCNTHQFPALPFCGPNSKPYGERGFIKHYHFRFDPKLGNSVCAIRRIPCAFFSCPSMLYKPWISDIPSYEHERYQPVTK